MAKYCVEICRFSDGSWYTKTQTDSYAAAVSVANNFFGRIGRIIDSETGEVRFFKHNVDWDRYIKNGVDINSIKSHV